MSGSRRPINTGSAEPRERLKPASEAGPLVKPASRDAPCDERGHRAGDGGGQHESRGRYILSQPIDGIDGSLTHKRGGEGARRESQCRTD